jgi:hypothetical protein
MILISAVSLDATVSELRPAGPDGWALMRVPRHHDGPQILMQDHTVLQSTAAAAIRRPARREALMGLKDALQRKLRYG